MTKCWDDTHACTFCRPDLLRPLGPPLHEGHISVRFGHAQLRDARLILNGQDVTNEAYEAILGVEGYVWRFVKHAGGEKMGHAGCPNLCAEVVIGNVQVEPVRMADAVTTLARVEDRSELLVYADLIGG